MVLIEREVASYSYSKLLLEKIEHFNVIFDFTFWFNLSYFRIELIDFSEEATKEVVENEFRVYWIKTQPIITSCVPITGYFPIFVFWLVKSLCFFGATNCVCLVRLSIRSLSACSVWSMFSRMHFLTNIELQSNLIVEKFKWWNLLEPMSITAIFNLYWSMSL